MHTCVYIHTLFYAYTTFIFQIRKLPNVRQLVNITTKIETKKINTNLLFLPTISKLAITIFIHVNIQFQTGFLETKCEKRARTWKIAI